MVITITYVYVHMVFLYRTNAGGECEKHVITEFCPEHATDTLSICCVIVLYSIYLSAINSSSHYADSCVVFVLSAETCVYLSTIVSDRLRFAPSGSRSFSIDLSLDLSLSLSLPSCIWTSVSLFQTTNHDLIDPIPYIRKPIHPTARYT